MSNMQVVRREAVSHLLAPADEDDRAAAAPVAFGHTTYLHPEAPLRAALRTIDHHITARLADARLPSAAA
jgi:hypothetical protein